MGDYCFFAVVLCLTSFRQVGQAFNGCHAAGGEKLITLQKIRRLNCVEIGVQTRRFPSRSCFFA